MGDVYYSDTFNPFVSLTDTSTTANRIYANPVLVPGSMRVNRILFDAYNADGSNAHTLYYAIYQETAAQVITKVMSGSVSIIARTRMAYVDITDQNLTAGHYYVLFITDSSQIQLKTASISVDPNSMKTPWWQYDQGSTTFADAYSWQPPVYLSPAPWCALINRYEQ